MGASEKKIVSISRPLAPVSFSLLLSAFLLSCLSPIVLKAQTQEELTSLSERVSLGTIDVKRDALLALARFRSEKASRVAEKGLRDDSEIVRATAIRSVVFLPVRDASSLIIPFLNDKSAFIRKETCYAFGGHCRSAKCFRSCANAQS